MGACISYDVTLEIEEVQIEILIYLTFFNKEMSRGDWTGVLGPAKPVRYPLSGGGTLLFIVTVKLLLWPMYML